MRILLDTHALYWVLREPHRLSSVAKQAILGPENEIFVSAVTSFELATKSRIGKFPGALPLLLTFEDQLARLRASTLPISSHHGIIAGGLAWDHRDRFDRLLAAQSMTENMSFITADPVFTNLAGVRVLWD
jgi:PIN domain nuclease of toxin-antitoxin system